MMKLGEAIELLTDLSLKNVFVSIYSLLRGLDDMMIEAKCFNPVRNVVISEIISIFKSLLKKICFKINTCPKRAVIVTCRQKD